MEALGARCLSPAGAGRRTGGGKRDRNLMWSSGRGVLPLSLLTESPALCHLETLARELD